MSRVSCAIQACPPKLRVSWSPGKLRRARSPPWQSRRCRRSPGWVPGQSSSCRRPNGFMPTTSGSVRLLRPDGSEMANSGICDADGFLDATSIDASGTWTVVIDPAGTGIGSVTVQLYLITDQTGTISTGGAKAKLSVKVISPAIDLTSGGNSTGVGIAQIEVHHGRPPAHQSRRVMPFAALTVAIQQAQGSPAIDREICRLSACAERRRSDPKEPEFQPAGDGNWRAAVLALPIAQLPAQSKAPAVRVADRGQPASQALSQCGRERYKCRRGR